MKELMTVGEVSEKFGIHPNTLRRWDKEGKLKAIRMPSKQRRYRKIDIDNLIKEKGEINATK